MGQGSGLSAGDGEPDGTGLSVGEVLVGADGLELSEGDPDGELDGSRDSPPSRLRITTVFTGSRCVRA